MALPQNTHVYMETVETSKTKKRNLIKMGVHEYYANMAANCRRGHWYCANLTTVKKAMTKERLINGGFYDLATAYQSVPVNYSNRRLPNGTHGGVRGRRLVTASYSIRKQSTLGYQPDIWKAWK